MIGNKDIDRKLFNNLEDEDLVNVCQVNKKAQSICNDQVFWMNRVFNRFGYVEGDVLRKNKDKYWPSWSEYYIKDLRKINSINATDKLFFGSEKGRLDHVIISLMGHGANIHTQDDQALRWASFYGQIEVVKYLVELKPDGANIHARNDQALEWASTNGHLDIVKYLIELKPDGANIHAINDQALRWASENGHLGVVKYLVELKPDGANIHALGDYALRWSSKKGHIEVVKYLVGQGANIHAKDNYAVIWASYFGQLDIVRYLVSNGANIHAKSSEIFKYDWSY